jgi:hypothetical protein
MAAHERLRSGKYPSRGPEPLLLQRSQVDALYDVLSLILSHLATLRIPCFLVAGSCLGAVRQASILFCDDDVDLAVFHEDLDRVRAELPVCLGRAATYLVRPWPGGDRVRPAANSSVWVDVFAVKRFEDWQELRGILAVKANGAPQPESYVETIRTALKDAGAMFPLYHYDARKAIELWPREFLTPSELLPLNEHGWFGHLRVPLPARPCGYLRRAYGFDCFESFKLATSHIDWSPDIRERLLAARAAAQAAGDHHTVHLLSGAATPLKDEHYVPLQHSSRAKRVWSDHDRRAVLLTVACEEALQTRLSLADTLTMRPHDELRSPSSSTEATQSAAITFDAVAAASTGAAVNSDGCSIAAPCASPSTSSTMTEAETLARVTSAADTVATVSQTTAARPPPKSSWFGAAMAMATCNSPQAFDFTSALLDVMSPHCLKARNLRATRQAEQLLSSRVLAGLADPTFLALTSETMLTYDTLAFDLPHHLAHALGMPADLPLCRFHEHAAGVSGGKDVLLARLREPSHRAAFHAVFDEMVRKTVLPHVAVSTGVRAPIYYQVCE